MSTQYECMCSGILMACVRNGGHLVETTLPNAGSNGIAVAEHIYMQGVSGGAVHFITNHQTERHDVISSFPYTKNILIFM